MNPSQEHLPLLDEGIFDRLVDGELTEAQRRDLLLSLDRHPNGWRRCALAFLESQCWRGELRDFRRLAETDAVASAGSPPTEDTHVVVPRRGRFDGGRLKTVLAVAASFLIALVIGMQMNTWKEAQPDRDWRVAGNLRDAPLQSARIAPPSASRDPWEMVTLTGTGSPNHEIRLPARESRGWNGDWYSSRSSIPQEVLDALGREGGKVRRSWQFLPMPLEDGRQLVVPVDQVDVRYPEYQ